MLRRLFAAWGRRRLPMVDGEIGLPGLRESAEVFRDPWGVPHVYARSAEDLFFAQGFVHAQDRLWQMELNRRTGTGTLSELFGRIALDTDRTVRTFGWNRLGLEDYERFPPETRGVIDAYVAGVNAFLNDSTSRLPLEFSLLRHRPRPWETNDVMAFSRLMMWRLSCSWYGDLVRARLRRAVGEVHATELELPYPAENPRALARGIEFNVLDPDGTLRGAAGPFLKRGKGSNAWAVSGSRTASGAPLLCNDMHLEIGVPSLWYEMHLSGGGVSASGVTLPGLPLVMVGHNERIAWGITLSYADCEDLFVEKFSADEPDRVLFRGEWEKAVVIEESIKVKGRREPHVEKVTITRHGPVISDVVDCGGQRLAVASMALRSSATLEGWLQMNRAQGWDDFVRAVRLLETPQFNIAYADVEGNIGYWHTGRVPVRASGDGMVPVPGWTGEHEWVGEIPFEEMPHALNPACGFVVTCNNRSVGEEYPHYLGRTFLNGFRARRITEVLESGTEMNADDMARLQQDPLSLPGRRFAEVVVSLGPDDPEASRAVRLLDGWDGRLLPESVAGAVYKVSSYHFVRFILEPLLGKRLADQMTGEGFHPVLQGLSELLGRDSQLMLHFLDHPDSWWVREAGGRDAVLVKSLARAVRWLRESCGTDEKGWRWGRIHSLTLAHAMSMKKPLDRIFNLGPVPMGGDSDTPLQASIIPSDPYHSITAAPSHRQIIDLGDLSKSRMIHPPGQSGQLGSPHYDDLLEPWRRGEHHPMLWDRSEVERFAEARLLLNPRETDVGVKRC